MQTIKIVPDKELLQVSDRAARRTEQNRSALVRDALCAHLRRGEIRALEDRDHAGYASHSDIDDDPLAGKLRRYGRQNSEGDILMRFSFGCD